jgi:hypothetical protein
LLTTRQGEQVRAFDATIMLSRDGATQFLRDDRGLEDLLAGQARELGHGDMLDAFRSRRPG